MGGQDFGWDPVTLHRLAQDIREVTLLGCQLCLVIGGGNIFRGSSKVAEGIERATADYMGMLATIMNALALQSTLEKIKVPARVVSAIEMDAVCESYARRRALAYLNARDVIIFAAGTGNPFFTTDTAAALRASEMGCDVLLKGTKVDGVYSADPFQDQKATFYPRLSYQQVLQENFRIMDAAAISLARDNHIPILVFSIQKAGELKRVLLGEGTFTIISNESSREN